MTEYGLILDAVAIVAVVACATPGTTISTLMNNGVNSIAKGAASGLNRC